MQLRLLILIVFIFGCHSNRHNDEVLQFTLPTSTEINIDYKTYNQCTTYFFKVKDTNEIGLIGKKNFYPCRVIGYDEIGNEKEIVYDRYEGYVPATGVSLYDSAGNLMEYYYKNNDADFPERASKTVYYYNNLDKVIKTITYDFEKRIRKDVDKGLGRPGGCIITPEDYEKKKSWAVHDIWNYKYDDNGRLLEKYASVGHAGQNRYLYKYDTKNRLIEEHSLEDDELLYIERYTYYDGGYEFTRTSYEKGERSKDWKGRVESVDTFRYKTDRFGNELQELVLEEGGRQVNKSQSLYDEMNRIIRKELYNENDSLIGVYIHKYKNGKEAISKKFYVANN